MDGYQQHFKSKLVNTCIVRAGLRCSAGSWWRHHELRGDMLKNIIVLHKCLRIQSSLITPYCGESTSSVQRAAGSTLAAPLWVSAAGGCDCGRHPAGGWFTPAPPAAAAWEFNPHRASEPLLRELYCVCYFCANSVTGTHSLGHNWNPSKECYMYKVVRF